MSNAQNLRPASDKQLAFITKLLAEKDVHADDRFLIAHDIDNTLSSKGASQWIDFLLARQRATTPTLDIAVTARDRVSEEGFYKNDDGNVFKVVRTRDGQRLYAKQSTSSGLVFIPGGMGTLFADQKLTGEGLAALGITLGFCIVCSSEFEDPTSKHIGIGPTCGKNQFGPDAYKALRLTVADKPDVIAFEAAKKAKAKEARDAKKAAAAQQELVLV